MGKTNFAKYLDGKKWTVEQFARESTSRGFMVQVGTAYRWHNGVMPRVSMLEALKKIFPGIKF